MPTASPSACESEVGGMTRTQQLDHQLHRLAELSARGAEHAREDGLCLRSTVGATAARGLAVDDAWTGLLGSARLLSHDRISRTSRPSIFASSARTRGQSPHLERLILLLTFFAGQLLYW